MIQTNNAIRDYQDAISYLYKYERMFYKRHINPKSILRFPKQIAEYICSADNKAINQMTFHLEEGIEPLVKIYKECYSEVSMCGSIDKVKYPLACVENLFIGALRVLDLLGYKLSKEESQELFNSTFNY